VTPLTVSIAGAIGSILMVLVVLELIRKRRLKERYALLWLATGIVLLILSPWVMHRDPRWWPDPLRFDVDRHLGQAKAHRNKFTYFPFSHGPRNCIGEPFAWMEGILILAGLGQAWRFRPVAGRPVVLDPLFTLRPKRGLWMTPEPRP